MKEDKKNPRIADWKQAGGNRPITFVVLIGLIISMNHEGTTLTETPSKRTLTISTLYE
jgi:hypothetical protein